MVIALVTHARHFAGPAAVEALTQDGYTVVCHDASFADAAERQRFESENPGTIALAEQKPERLVDATLQHGEAIDTIVSNDYIPRPMNRLPLEGTSEADIRQMFEALSIFPILLLQSAIAPLRAAGGASVIFITSSVGKKPLAYNPLYGPARAATVALVESAAKTLSRDGILLYAIGPNFFNNPTYFPTSDWENNPELRERVDRDVPLGRLGRPDEMGALITFLASRRAAPIVGQFFAFTGGYLP
uniref:Halohydrin dehalogenase n=1 Tax=Arthrobacter sp. AD2 TaxID=168809 RepID=Q93MS3_9MICC|nr:Chain A, halohydrin dehalogenase [Arthrobacter sp. AD2]1ZMO_B Chain B, halohydrin dehalogenase [Arthrobacter sp. AD2]1ZMO_C Chain C, halohydrin dehalogenase [Arthrobacter sp. AD2]1ZMO_D Chain D, halohydrin dehalogenase [Arthrobacter sp. AD2]1ZMO_E Chain E, halohydrin dehalogenase [Arthrobacter sp. AD2]1ZMO_F Chain F, halohydrin dehalogenase [Arthrobacter sp. AD2]1ZMO_G Chain G, halohydrin dehalogenase [Arthrobacter sp. AD2]1ZMO_H Chain H, halohydrin dehalogenase [Arthrobacter sp. AD2]AAK